MAIKVFVSQPMQGRDASVIDEERKMVLEAVARRVDDDIREIPSFNPLAPDGNSLKQLGQAIRLMADADVVAFAPGWRGARGCIVEHLCAEKYGLVVIDLEVKEDAYDED